MREDEGLAHTVLAEAGLTDDLLTEMIRETRRFPSLRYQRLCPEPEPQTKHVLEIALEDAIRGGYAYIGTSICWPASFARATIWRSGFCGLPVWTPVSCTRR